MSRFWHKTGRCRIGKVERIIVLMFAFAISAEALVADTTLPSFNLAQHIVERDANEPWEALSRRLETRKRVGSSLALEAVAWSDGVALLEDLMELGLTEGERYGRHVYGVLPGASLSRLEDVAELHDVRAASVRYSAGAVSSEGDQATRADIARSLFSVSGTGVVVGVISDSYNCLGGALADIASGDLPDNIRVLKEASDCESATDEGRALMQIVHDIAPGAALVFRTGSGGVAGVANAILELTPVVDVIVDDAFSVATPWFQAGAIAQASREAVASGVVHVTAAGNEGRLSYESLYREHVFGPTGLRLHDFDAGPGTDVLMAFDLPEGETFELVMQWDDPAFSVSGLPGASTDLDLYITDESGNELLAASEVANLGRDPIERLGFRNPTGSGRTRFNLMIVRSAGESPSLLKTIVFGRFAGEFLEYDTKSSTIVGHPNSESAITVGAIDHAQVVTSGDTPPPVRQYSSAGGTQLLFDTSGLKFVEPIQRDKPDLVAPDGVSTTFFNTVDAQGAVGEGFVGTSASAPHVAGVVALLLQARPDLLPRDINSLLRSGAVDVVARENSGPFASGDGFDFDSGAGLVDAAASMELLSDHDLLPDELISSPETLAADSPVVVGAIGSGELRWSLVWFVIIFGSRLRIATTITLIELYPKRTWLSDLSSQSEVRYSRHKMFVHPAFSQKEILMKIAFVSTILLLTIGVCSSAYADGSGPALLDSLKQGDAAPLVDKELRGRRYYTNSNPDFYSSRIIQNACSSTRSVVPKGAVRRFVCTGNGWFSRTSAGDSRGFYVYTFEVRYLHGWAAGTTTFRKY